MSGASSLSAKWRLKTLTTARATSFSTTRSSRVSSPSVSSSIFPAVDATTAGRSLIRGAAAGSPSRTARFSAAAASVSWLEIVTRTLTPERCADLGRSARQLRQLGDDLLHEAGNLDRDGSVVIGIEGDRLGVDDRHLGVALLRVVRPDLRAESVLQRRDDPPAAGVVLGVGAGDHEQVELQAHPVAAHLDVALLHHVEEADLDALGQVRQLVEAEDGPMRPRQQPVVDRELVGQVAALGHLDRVHLADEVGDADVRGAELLAVPILRRPPADAAPHRPPRPRSAAPAARPDGTDRRGARCRRGTAATGRAGRRGSARCGSWPARARRAG